MGPVHRLSLHNTYEDTVSLFDRHAVEYTCVLDEKQNLLGVVTRKELFAAFELGKDPATKVQEFMRSDPIVITPDQTPWAIAELMHKHDLDWLPVVENKETRHLIGIVRSERMLRCLVSHSRV